MLSHRSFCSVVLYIVCLYYHLMVRIASIKLEIDNSFFSMWTTNQTDNNEIFQKIIIFALAMWNRLVHAYRVCYLYTTTNGIVPVQCEFVYSYINIQLRSLDLCSLYINKCWFYLFQEIYVLNIKHILLCVLGDVYFFFRNQLNLFFGIIDLKILSVYCAFIKGKCY